MVVSEGYFAGNHTFFYDLFRVEYGKIAEHWDTIEITLHTPTGRTLTANFNSRYFWIEQASWAE